MRQIINRLNEALETTTLYHVTAASNAERIQREGVRPVSYWSTDDLVSYYAETIRDEGSQPVVFRVDLNDLDPRLIEPDYESIAEPITTAIGMSEEEVHELWENSSQNWQDSLKIVGSIRYRGVVRPSLDD